MLSPAGEFAFVLIPLAASSGFLSAEQSGLVSTLAATHHAGRAVIADDRPQRLLKRIQPMMRLIDEDFPDAGGKVLLIGFGRFGQVDGAGAAHARARTSPSSTSTSR